MPDPVRNVQTALTANQHCNVMGALILDIAAASALLDFHEANGNADGVEGCRQTIRSANEALSEHLGYFRELVKPKEDK